MAQKWISCAGFLMATAVALGALGAHALKDKFDAYSMAIWEKAVLYHSIHALAILIVVALTATSIIAEAPSQRVCYAFFFGIVLFSFSLYALALTKMKWLGAITPLGGLLFIFGWVVLALAASRH